MQVDFCACEIRGLIERFSAEIVKQAVYQEIPSCKPVSDDIPLWEPKTGREETFVEQAKRVLREKISTSRNVIPPLI